VEHRCEKVLPNLIKTFGIHCGEDPVLGVWQSYLDRRLAMGDKHVEATKCLRDGESSEGEHRP